MFNMSFKAAKEGFFDRQVIVDAVDRASLRVLSKFGAFVRMRAKSSIRKRKKASAPGSPPSSHVGLLKKLIFFSFDRSTKSVVIGPTLINTPTGAPETLEYGGQSDITFTQFRRRGDRNVREKKTKRVKIAARPFMGPAFDAEKPGLPAMWKDSVR